MNDLKRDLRAYIDGIADPVRAAEAETRRRRPVRPIVAVALGAAIVLIPLAVLYAAGIIGGDPSGPATQPTESPPATTVTPTTAPVPPTTQPESVTVPDVVGLGADEAASLLETLGLVVDTYGVLGEQGMAGTIVAQDPLAGSVVGRASVIRLGVSTTATCDPGPRPEPADDGQVVVVLFHCPSPGDALVPDVTHPGYRIVDSDVDPLVATLEALLEGPTADEMEAGYTSFFGPATAGSLQSVTVEDGRAVIDFAPSVLAPNSSTSTGMVFFHAELYANVFQHPAIQSVEFTLDGSCEAWAGAFEGDRCQVMTRDAWETAYGSG